VSVRQRLQNLEKEWDQQYGTDYVREALRRNRETGELPSHEHTAELVKDWRLLMIRIEMTTGGAMKREELRVVNLPFEPTDDEWSQMEAELAEWEARNR
jgi:hypothetical protein